MRKSREDAANVGLVTKTDGMPTNRYQICDMRKMIGFAGVSLLGLAAYCAFVALPTDNAVNLRSQQLEQTVATTTLGRPYTLLNNGNMDYPGNDIAYWQGPFSGCAAKCDVTPKCVAYTLHKDNGANCWLKSVASSPTPNTNRDTYLASDRSYTLLNKGNVDYPGNDIAYWQGPFSGCAAQCDVTPNCVAYTLHKDNGANCWLKYATQNPTASSNRDTYRVGRGYALLNGGNMDYPGNDITYWQGPFSGCGAQCDATPNCVAYTLHKDVGANCWLKYAAQNPTPNNNRDTYIAAGRSYTLLNGGGVDYPGSDITYWYGPFSGCAAQCDVTPNCVAYTLHRDNNANCWLKSATNNPTVNSNRDTYMIASKRSYTVLNGGNVDYPGNDLKYWEGPFSQCAAQCDATPNCVAYTLHKDVGRNCWLKSQATNPTANSNRDTYLAAQSYKILNGGNVDYPGNDIAYWQGSFSNCAAKCDATPGCVAYTLHKDNGANCWLKSAARSPTPSSVRDTYTRARSYTLLNGGNVDYPGNDLTYYQGPFSHCAAQCDATANCVAYTLHKDNGANCWLKSATQNRTPNSARDTYTVATVSSPN